MLAPTKEYRFVVIAILLAVCLSRAGLERAKPNTQSDMAWQLNGAYNLLHGHGLKREAVGSNDWSQTVWEPLIYWPPGYSLAAAALGFFTGDFLQAAWILQVLALLAFLATTYFLAGLLGVSTQAYVFMIIPFGLPFHFIDRFSCTDLPSLAFYQLGVYLILLGYRRQNGPIFHLAAGVALFAAGMFRYAYYPILMAPPAALFLAGLYTKEPKVRRNALCVATSLTLCLLLQSAANLHYAGSAVYTEPQEEMKLYPENLARFNNFVAEAFFNEESPLSIRLAGISSAAEKAVRWIGFAFAAMMVAMLLRSGCLERRTGKAGKRPGEGLLLLWISIGTMAANGVSLVYFSLTSAPQTDWTSHWTYVGENRYFAPSMLCLLWWVARLASSGRDTGTMRRLPLAVLLAHFSFSMAGASLELYRSVPSPSALVSRDLLAAATKIRNLSGQMEVRPVVVSPFDNAPLLALYGARIVRMEEYPFIIADQKIPSSRSLPVLFWCSRPASEEEEQFLDSHGAREILKLRASSLFKIGAW